MKWPPVPPNKENVTVEEPPVEILVPEGATYKPWNELKTDECAWSLGDFWETSMSDMPCCGLPVLDKGKRFCEFHKRKAILNVVEN